MDVVSFSASPARSLFPEVFVPRKIRIAEWYRGSVSIFPIKCSFHRLPTDNNLLIQKGYYVQVSCSQKSQSTVIEARCMDEIYDTLAKRLVPTAAAATDTHFKHIVGIAGPPGAGKTTVACEVARRVNMLWPQKSCSFDSQVQPPDVAIVLPMDGFHLYRHQLDAMKDPVEAHARRGAPWTFDPELFLACLKTLRDQGSVYAPSFDHGVGDPIKDDIFVNLQHKVVIVEGNYLFLQEGAWKEISSLFDEKWFVDIDIDKAMQRVLRRHISTGKPENVARSRVENNDRPNAELILKTKKKADIIIKSVDL